MKKYMYIVFLFATIACDNSLEIEDININVSGQIINGSTQAPLKGMSVVLKVFTGSGWTGSSHIVASAITDNNGEYRLSYEGKDNNNGVHIYFNSSPYTGDYSTDRFSVSNGKHDFRTILYQNTGLSVIMRSQNPLESRTYTLWLPGVGTSIDSMLGTNRAKGNFYNEVRLNYTRDNVHYEVKDSVFCPINKNTRFILYY